MCPKYIEIMLPSIARRQGFTLAELLVVLAVIVILAAVIVPHAVRTADKARVEAAAAALQNVSDAIKAFRDAVRQLPGDLRHLVEPLSAGQRACNGQPYSGAERGRWNGPYLDRLVPATGLPVAIGTALLPIVPDTSTSNARIQVVNVLEEDAIALNELVDGDGSRTSGTVRWTLPDARGLVTLYYQTPYRC
jgi:prepilin-type N-terminal cleavage/methylation domain-containing protein